MALIVKKITWLGGITYFLSMVLLFSITVFYVRKGPQNNTTAPGIPEVSVQQKDGKYFFLREGKPFFIKGAAGYSQLQELAAAGGNTVVCWDTAVLETVLREADRYKLAVIVGIDVPGVHNTGFYEDKQQLKTWQQSSRSLVDRYKNHPALLAWCLGNELIFPFSPVYDPFYKAYNSLLNNIHQADPHHPVFTTVINLDKKNILNLQWRVPGLDFIGLNIYNSLRTLQNDLKQVSLYWRGPYIIAEWAPHGGWEAKGTSWYAPLEQSSTQKAAAYYQFYTQHMPLQDPRFMGSVVFYWGCRYEYTYTWYSVFNEDGTATEIAEYLRDCWTGAAVPHISPVITGIFSDNRRAEDDIILSAGSEHTAAVTVQTAQQQDSMRFTWQIIKEQWVDWGKVWVSFKKPAVESGLFEDSTVQRPRFTAPTREGPYRIYVTVYGAGGYCATANIPFYVISQ